MAANILKGWGEGHAPNCPRVTDVKAACTCKPAEAAASMVDDVRFIPEGQKPPDSSIETIVGPRGKSRAEKRYRDYTHSEDCKRRYSGSNRLACTCKRAEPSPRGYDEHEETCPRRESEQNACTCKIPPEKELIHRLIMEVVSSIPYTYNPELYLSPAAITSGAFRSWILGAVEHLVRRSGVYAEAETFLQSALALAKDGERNRFNFKPENWDKFLDDARIYTDVFKAPPMQVYGGPNPPSSDGPFGFDRILERARFLVRKHGREHHICIDDAETWYVWDDIHPGKPLPYEIGKGYGRDVILCVHLDMSIEAITGGDERQASRDSFAARYRHSFAAARGTKCNYPACPCPDEECHGVGAEPLPAPRISPLPSEALGPPSETERVAKKGEEARRAFEVLRQELEDSIARGFARATGRILASEEDASDFMAKWEKKRQEWEEQRKAGKLKTGGFLGHGITVTGVSAEEAREQQGRIGTIEGGRFLCPCGQLTALPASPKNKPWPYYGFRCDGCLKTWLIVRSPDGPPHEVIRTDDKKEGWPTPGKMLDRGLFLCRCGYVQETPGPDGGSFTCHKCLCTWLDIDEPNAGRPETPTPAETEAKPGTMVGPGEFLCWCGATVATPCEGGGAFLCPECNKPWEI